MIRHRCAACGDHINRTDQLFEDSDGTLCAVCLARLTSALPRRLNGGAVLPPAPPPAWSVLPELLFQRIEPS